MSDTDVAILGAGPYGLTAAAHLRRAGVDVRVLGDPMSFWRGHADRNAAEVELDRDLHSRTSRAAVAGVVPRRCRQHRSTGRFRWPISSSTACGSSSRSSRIWTAGWWRRWTAAGRIPAAAR